MLSTNTEQKQYGVNRNKMMTEFSMAHTKLGPSAIIKTMLKIIKIKSNDTMNEEARTQFSKMVDAAIRMAEEI